MATIFIVHYNMNDFEFEINWFCDVHKYTEIEKKTHTRPNGASTMKFLNGMQTAWKNSTT